MMSSREREELFRRYYDPRDSVQRDTYRRPEQRRHATFGIVEDTRDPGRLGRVKVHMPMLAPDARTWVALVRPCAGAHQGVWAPPEPGDYVLIGFIQGDPSAPVALGSWYGPGKHGPVAENPGNDLKVMTSTSGLRVEVRDTAGEERIVLSARDGAMRIEISPRGVSVVNDGGDIRIACRAAKLSGEAVRIAAADSGSFGGSKAVAVSCQDGAIQAGGSVCWRGGSVALQASAGVTAEGRQIALRDDQVVGIDLHDIRVPSSSGTKTVPQVPHPYLGRLQDSLSGDVQVNSRDAATKGSKSVYTTPGHFPMPPGVKFKKKPSNEGTVSSATTPSVKINGKEAAVLGSMVSTCNDPRDQETCSIIAAGAAVKLPILLPGMDRERFEQDGGTVFNTGEPLAGADALERAREPRSLEGPGWSTSEAMRGDEVTLSVSVCGAPEGEPVMLSIFREDQGEVPVATVPGRNQGGSVTVSWRPGVPDDREDREEVRLFFRATAYRCQAVDSGIMTVEKPKPVFSELKWELVSSDEDTQESGREEISRIEHGLTGTMSATVENLEDGQNVNVLVYEAGHADRQSGDRPLARILTEVIEGRVEARWQVSAGRERLAELTQDDELKYVFLLETPDRRAQSAVSPECQAVFVVYVSVRLNPDEMSVDGRIRMASVDDTSYTQDQPIGEPEDGNHILATFDEVLPGQEYRVTIHMNSGTERVVHGKLPFLQAVAALQ